MIYYTKDKKELVISDDIFYKNMNHGKCGTIYKLNDNLCLKRYDRGIYFNHCLLNTNIYEVLNKIKSDRNSIKEEAEVCIRYQKDSKFHKYADFAVERCKKIVTISKDSDKLVVDTFKNVNGKNIIIKNGYDPDVFYPEKYDKKAVLRELGINKEFDRVVSFVGKLTNFKGVDILLKACKEYEDENTLTLITGDGELYKELNELKEKLNLKNVVFLGNRPHETLRKIYNIADVSIVPSRREPFGLVALEAMACGTPVIGTNQGGIPDFLKKDVGILVEVENVEQLAKAILSVLNKEVVFDRSYIAKYVKENHSQDALTNELIEVYKEALDS